MAIASQFTGGEVLYYSSFDVQYHGERLYYDLFRNLSRASGNEVQIKVRISKTCSVTDYFGAFGLREGIDVVLSGIDADKSFGVSFRTDKEMAEGELVNVQTAILYTNQFG